MSGRMIRELSGQQPDVGDTDLANRLIGRAQTYYQAVEHASQTGAFRREAERMGAGTVHICVYNAFVSLHPNDKQAQNAFFTRLVSAAALPKATFQQGIRDLNGLLSKQSELTSTPSRSSLRSSESARSTPHKTPSSAASLRTPRSARMGLSPDVRTPESVQASAKKLLDPKYLSTLRSGGDASSGFEGSAAEKASPVRTPTHHRGITPAGARLTPSSRSRAGESPNGKSASRDNSLAPPSAGSTRRTLRTVAMEHAHSRSPGTPTAAKPTATASHLQPAVPPPNIQEAPQRSSTHSSKRKALPAWDEDSPLNPHTSAEGDTGDETVRMPTPQKRARFMAAIQNDSPVEEDEDEEEEAQEQEHRKERATGTQSNVQDWQKGMEGTSRNHALEHEAKPNEDETPRRPGAKQQALYARSMFRLPPWEMDPASVRRDETVEWEDAQVSRIRQRLISTLLPQSLSVGRGRRARAPPPVGLCTAEWLGPWHDALAIGWERLHAGVPEWMSCMHYGDPLPLEESQADLRRWLHLGASDEK